MKVIILGDVHLGAGKNIGKTGIGSALNSRIVDQLKLLDWVLDKSIEYNSDIIITGDIFEEPQPNSSLINLFISWLKKCLVYNTNVHIIMGNHDFLRNGSIIYSPLDIINELELPNTFVYKQINTVFIENAAFTLIPYKDHKSLGTTTNSDAIETLKNILIYELSIIPQNHNKVLIGHLALEGAIPSSGEIDDISDTMLCPVDMFTGYQQVFMGHVHKHQVLNKEPYVSHIGSMDISNFSESEQKKYIAIYDTESGKFDLETIPTRPIKKISINIPIDVVDSTEYVLSELKKINYNFSKSIVKIEVSLFSASSKSVNKSEIESYLKNLNVYNITGIFEYKKISIAKKSKETSTINTNIDVPSAIKKYADLYVLEDNKSKFINTCMEIYNLSSKDNK